MKWVLLVLGVAAGSARADSTAALSVDAADLAAAIEALPVQLEEPIGLVARSRNPTLGLEKGDVIRAINGGAAIAAHGGFSADTTIMYLDVVRGRRAVTIRLQVKPPTAADKLEREDFKYHVDWILQNGADVEFTQVTRSGRPSGVVIRAAALWSRAVRDGDVIRKVDGVAIDTVAHLLAALTRAADHPRVELGIERVGQPIAVILTLTVPNPAFVAGIAKIKKLNDTTYELPRSFVDAALDDPLAALEKARLIPATKDGAAIGFKIYAIRPGSALATLGILNGDTLISVDGIELSAPDKALGDYQKLRTATEVKVEIERRQVPMTLTYRIK